MGVHIGVTWQIWLIDLCVASMWLYVSYFFTLCCSFTVISVMAAEPQQSVAHMTGTTRSIYAPSFDSDALMPNTDLPKLVHPSKERPRLPRKAQIAKRPVIACETLLADEMADDDVPAVNPNLLALPLGEKMPLYVVVCSHELFVYIIMLGFLVQR